MNRTQLEHIIRAASEISGDTEIVVIGSQAIHAQRMTLPPIAFQSDEADVYPRHHPERADEIDAAIGELFAVPRHARLLWAWRRPDDCHSAGGLGTACCSVIEYEHGWRGRTVHRRA